jgi:hypothetical protein
MGVDKVSISMEPALGEAVRTAARRSGQPISGWLADAARDRLRAEAFDAFLDDWQERHGALTASELAAADAELRSAERDNAA